jgi:flagellar hook assembly protein FlgD
LLNNGNGAFAVPAAYQAGAYPWAIQSADFDLDGDMDIACANYNSNSITILFNAGESVAENKDNGAGSFLQIYPNPFRQTVAIRLQISGTDQGTSFKIYDITGRLIKDYPRLVLSASRPTKITWDGSDNLDRKVPNGIYFCRLETPEFTIIKQVVLVR